MKKILAISLFMLLVINTNAQAQNPTKVNIIHNGNMIQVSINALQALLDQGDQVLVLYNGNWITGAEYDTITSDPEANLSDIVYEYHIYE